MRYLTHDDIDKAVQDVVPIIREQIDRSYEPGAIRIYPIPRGGIPVAYLILKYVKEAGVVVSSPEEANVFVDDLIDSGATFERYADSYPETPFITLYDKRLDEKPEWLVFPWETSDTGQLDEDIPLRLLQFIGEDVNRGGLQETPQRFLGAWKQWTCGYHCRPEDVLKTFEDGSARYDEMVLVKDIPVYSHCEHHLAPFFGIAHVAYIPDKRIIGLSKIPRLVDIFARRLQVQERLTTDISHSLRDSLKPLGVGVVLRCRHLCMESRGIERPGTETVTSSLLGVFMQPEVRQEFMGLVR